MSGGSVTKASVRTSAHSRAKADSLAPSEMAALAMRRPETPIR